MQETAATSLLRVIVPVFGDVEAKGALRLAASLAKDSGHLVVLGVIPVPRGSDIPAATTLARTRRAQLRALAGSIPSDISREVLVRAAETPFAGVRQVAEEGGGLLVVPLPERDVRVALGSEPYRQLVDLPVCDTVFVRAGSASQLRSVLVAARGGPHAELALRIGQRLARAEGAELTVLHVDVPHVDDRRRQQEQHLFRSLVAGTTDVHRVRAASVPAESAEQPIVEAAARHDALVLGAYAGPGDRSGYLGSVPLTALDRSTAAVLVAKSRSRVNPAIFRPRPPAIDALVSTWFVENTSHCREFAAVGDLIDEKARRNLTVGVALLANASRDTFPAFARVLFDDLQVGPGSLVDEVTVFSPPDAELRLAAESAGFSVCEVQNASGDQYGRLLHASLRELTNDIVIWLDADVRNPHAKFVYGLAGPLILNDHIRYVKGFHRLAQDAPDADLLDLVDEFSARPLLNLFFAELSGVIDPLGTDHAIRRAAGIELPLFSGSAAQLGLLVDVAERFGLGAIAQVALEERIARPPDVAQARRRAFSAAQIITGRLGMSDVGGDRRTPTIKVIQQTGDRLEIAEIDAREAELPPGGPAKVAPTA